MADKNYLDFLVKTITVVTLAWLPAIIFVIADDEVKHPISIEQSQEIQRSMKIQSRQNFELNKLLEECRDKLEQCEEK